jgi:hypothetical protein
MNTKLLSWVFLLWLITLSCGKNIEGKYKNGEIIYNIKSDGSYEYIRLELDTQNMSDNEYLLQDYNKLPRKEKVQGRGKWRANDNQIFFEGPALHKEYLIKNGSLCTFDAIKNGEICFEK